MVKQARWHGVVGGFALRVRIDYSPRVMATARTSTPARTGSLLAGWPIVGWSTLVVAALCVLVLVAAGGGEAGCRATVRLTARTSFAFFIAAFVASSVRRLWPNALTRWLLANRRYIGVSFAASHAIHLLGIIALAHLVPDFTIGPPALIGGGLAYVFLAAMTATSFDRTAAWLGSRRWHLLHKSGMYWCWFIFFISYVPRALTASNPADSALYAPFVATLLGALVVRAAARSPA